MDEVPRFENALFEGNEAREWAALQSAGQALAREILRDHGELGAWSQNARLLVLAGKGHNAGDALVAARQLIAKVPGLTADVLFLFGQSALRPLAARAWRELVHGARGRVRALRGASSFESSYDVSIDGIFGFQFRPPLHPAHATAIAAANECKVAFRAAVDLPSGLGDRAAFRADFTYATGSVKAPLVAETNRPWVGRLRYLDLGFFSGGAHDGPRVDHILTLAALEPLRSLRASISDKRSYGHVMVVGASRSYPGAVVMAVQAAIRSGAGLVTAFVPEEQAAACAARHPEAMWVGWPLAPGGGLALEGLHLWQERCMRASVLLIGPGMGTERETRLLAAELVKSATCPLVLDADALQPDVLAAAAGRTCVLTPHAGEFARIAEGRSAETVAGATGRILVVKGTLTRIVGSSGDGLLSCYSPFGGPVLARGGSGDILAGLIAGVIAQDRQECFAATCRAVVWHGRAADELARAHGQTATKTTQLLDFLSVALRSGAT